MKNTGEVSTYYSIRLVIVAVKTNYDEGDRYLWELLGTTHSNIL